MAILFLEAWGKVSGTHHTDQHWELLHTLKKHLDYLTEEGDGVRLRLLSVLAFLLLVLKGILMSQH